MPTPSIPQPPDRDLYQIAQRLRLKSPEPIPQVVNPEPVSYQAGQRHEFWVVDMTTYVASRRPATLRVVTPNAYFYVEDGMAVSDEALERSAAEFENNIYPVVTGYFGQEWRPGVDNDPHLTIFHGNVPGVAGYYSSADEYPIAINPYSNEREMVYINTAAVQPGTDAYFAVLAHELTHATQWQADKGEETWLMEGLAELGVMLAGYQPHLAPAFLASPDTSLTIWEDELSRSAAHYGAAYLFARYLIQHYVTPQQLKALQVELADGAAGVEAFLQNEGHDVSFDAVFGDWVVANFLDYDVSISGTLAVPGEITGTVNQYAADYIAVSPGDAAMEIAFSGDATVSLLPAQPRSGDFMWWGNRGDSIDSTLTREFDLSGLQTASLSYWLWYDIEKNWDYAYVEASIDGGQTWTALDGQHTTREDPVGNSFGPAYTGKSDWVEERIDLTPYAGSKMWLRFEYITDEAVSRDGFAIDDISIPELGFFDGAEADAGWEGLGFMRADNQLQQRFIVWLIEPGDTPRVRPVALDSSQQGSVRVEAGERAVVVVAATAPVSGQPAGYVVSATPSG